MLVPFTPMRDHSLHEFHTFDIGARVSDFVPLPENFRFAAFA